MLAGVPGKARWMHGCMPLPCWGGAAGEGTGLVEAGGWRGGRTRHSERGGSWRGGWRSHWVPGGFGKGMDNDVHSVSEVHDSISYVPSAAALAVCVELPFLGLKVSHARLCVAELHNAAC